MTIDISRKLLRRLIAHAYTVAHNEANEAPGNIKPEQTGAWRDAEKAMLLLKTRYEKV